MDEIPDTRPNLKTKIIKSNPCEKEDIKTPHFKSKRLSRVATSSAKQKKEKNKLEPVEAMNEGLRIGTPHTVQDKKTETANMCNKIRPKNP